MKKLFSIILIFTISISVFSYNLVQAKEFDVGVDSAILIEAETGQTIFKKNINKKVPPASITKIMTLLLAMEAIEEGRLSLDDKVVISKHAESMGGSQIFLPDGIKLRFSELLKAVAIASANDASVAVAEAVGGSYNNFIQMMNKRATELGMEDTHFINSTGLPSEGNSHYSTVKDIAIMARELIDHPKVLEWTSTWVDYVQLPERKVMLVNTNELVKTYYGLDGLKTGHTDAAGYCLTATAKRENMRLISVVLNAETLKKRENITRELLNYGFNTYKKLTPVKKKTKVENIIIPDGKKTTTVGSVENDLSILVKIGQDNNYDVKTKINEDLSAPIKKGEVIGQKTIILNDQKIGVSNILATENIKKANFFVRLWRSFGNWIENLFS